MNEKRLLTVLPRLLAKLRAKTTFTALSLTIEETAALFTLVNEKPEVVAEVLEDYFTDAVYFLQQNPDTYLMRLEQAALIAHKDRLPDNLLVILTMRGVL
jgi:hypothetical protein